MSSVSNDDKTYYREEVDKFTTWCDENFLNLYVKKTKEMVVDFRNNVSEIIPLVIKEKNVDIVENYTYLGKCHC